MGLKKGISRFTLLQLWVLFVLFPVLLVSWGAQKSFEYLRNLEYREASRQLMQKARAIFALANEENYAKERFARAIDAPDPAFELILENGVASPYPQVNSLCNFLKTREMPDEETLNSWRDLFGHEISPQFILANESTPIPIRWQRFKAYLIWQKKTTGVKLVSSEGQIRLEIIVPPDRYKLLAFSLKRYWKKYKVPGGVLDFESGRVFRAKSIPLKRILHAVKNSRKYKTFTRQPEEFLALADFLEKQLVLYLERPLSRVSFLERPGNLFIVGFFVLALGAFFLPQILSRGATWSLKVKLFGIFSYLVFLPMLSMGFLSLSLINDQRKVSEQELKHLVRAGLLRFDEGLKIEMRNFEKRYERILNDEDLRFGRWEKFSKKCKSNILKNYFKEIGVWDWDSNRTVSLSKGPTEYSVYMVNELNAKRAINLALGRSEDFKLSRNEILLREILETPGLGLQNVTKKANTLLKIRFGDNLKYYFWRQLPQQTSPQAAYGNLVLEHGQMVFHYLQKNLIANRQFNIFLRERKTGKFFPENLAIGEISYLCDGIIKKMEDQFGWINFKGEKFFVFGISGLLLEGFDLVSLVPETRFFEETRKIKKFIEFGMAVNFFIGFACVIFLSRGLSGPIAEISKGIIAIKNHDFHFKIPIETNDELGKLAEAFNRMIETLGELDRAKVVQETLNAKRGPEVQGYKLEIFCSMISAIGGDYVDCFKTDSEKICFLIGDVAGHGVDSALVMAMAKSLVYLHFDEGNAEDDLMSKLNEAFFNLTFERQLMSFCLGAFHPISHEFSLFVAGNPYPFLWKARTKKAEHIGYPRYPLGIKLRQDFPEIKFVMEEGDLFFLYTDGLIEAANSDFLPFGYEKLGHVIEIGAPDGIKAVFELLRTELKNHLGNIEPLDDISFLAIQREKL